MHNRTSIVYEALCTTDSTMYRTGTDILMALNSHPTDMHQICIFGDMHSQAIPKYAYFWNMHSHAILEYAYFWNMHSQAISEYAYYQNMHSHYVFVQYVDYQK